MRKTKKIKIDDKEITVLELRVKDIRKILDSAEEISGFSDIETLLPMATDLKLKDLDELAPSEIRQIWQAFSEVNADFFGLAQKMGLEKILKSSISEHLTNAYADSLKAAISTPPSTGGGSS